MDHRLRYGLPRPLNQLMQEKERFWSFVWFTPWHPANLRSSLLNQLATPLFRCYGQLNLESCHPWLRSADLLVFESAPGLLLFNLCQQLNPNARYLYRVSDDLRLLKSHPVVLEAETQALHRFDLVSAPSQYIYQTLKQQTDQVMLQHHAIRKELFQREYPNPYVKPGPHLVFVGVAYFDLDFIRQASQLFPEWQFHIIGPIRGLPKRSNITAYGEIPFEQTLPYLKHADVGLHTLANMPGAASFSDSLKVIQYTYCKLPIVAPEFLPIHRSHGFYYRPGDKVSIMAALKDALQYDRHSVQTADIYSWDELVKLWCHSLALA